MAASAWQKLFPNGRGLLNGAHLNAIFTGAAGILGLAIQGTGLTVSGPTALSGASTLSGATTISGALTASGASKQVFAKVTATGTTQLGAKTVGTTSAYILVAQASTASTKGVRLPVAATGKVVQVANAAAFGVKVYPTSNGQIGAASTNAADSTVLAINKVNTYIGVSATKWIVERGA